MNKPIEYIILENKVDEISLSEVSSLNESQFKSGKVEYKRFFVGCEKETLEKTALCAAKKYSDAFPHSIIIVKKRTYEVNALAIPTYNAWKLVTVLFNR